jgi:glyoxylase-like metal-dependent hydrolase (beta-lactamase superfamily II)
MSFEAVIASPYSRRAFLVRAGYGTLALAVFGVVGCAPSSSSYATEGGEPDSVPGSPIGDAAVNGEDPTPADGDQSPRWERVDLGFVSAYILARAGEAAIVDTGVAGSEGAIAAGLERLGLDWAAVGHAIATHLHPDHIGSMAAVMDAAGGSTGYAGAADIPGIAAPRPLTPLGDGDIVFDLRVVATPGHTPGHISILDPALGVLVAGDALNTADGRATGPNPRFTPDMETAFASVARLGDLSFETLLVGHGDPVTSGASAQVKALAAG